MARFTFSSTPFTGLLHVQRNVLSDTRGFLSRFYCNHEFVEVLPNISQINHSLTCKRGCVRGMHFQYPPHAEIKLVTCLKGEIWDVAVDLRQDSPTFMQWYSCVLSAENHHSLLIPEGFAHGYQTLSEDCELMYLHSMSYYPQAEGALHAQDPKLKITWPLPISELSTRDSQHAFVDDKFKGLAL